VAQKLAWLDAEEVAEGASEGLRARITTSSAISVIDPTPADNRFAAWVRRTRRTVAVTLSPASAR